MRRELCRSSGVVDELEWRDAVQARCIELTPGFYDFTVKAIGILAELRSIRRYRTQLVMYPLRATAIARLSSLSMLYQEDWVLTPPDIHLVGGRAGAFSSCAAPRTRARFHQKAEKPVRRVDTAADRRGGFDEAGRNQSVFGRKRERRRSWLFLICGCACSAGIARRRRKHGARGATRGCPGGCVGPPVHRDAMEHS